MWILYIFIEQQPFQISKSKKIEKIITFVQKNFKNMKIILNNNPEIITTNDETISIQDVMVYKNFSHKRIIARVNNKVIHDENFDIPIIREGDNVQIIHLMCGG
jgi:thiamine biosynthesis protein ThiS